MFQLLSILEAGRVNRLEIYFWLGTDQHTAFHDPEQCCGASPQLTLAQK